MNKRLWIVVVLIAVLAVGGIIWVKNQGDNSKKTEYVNNISNEKVTGKANSNDSLAGDKALSVDDIAKAQEKTLGRKLTDEERAKIIPDHTLGKADSKVTVIEYEDFACTHCQQFHTYANQIQDDYKDRVQFIFRDFSLSYPNSIATLSAGEAAMKLGGNDAFWKMNKLLFQDEKWVGQAVSTKERKSVFNDYAKQSGITDIDKFNDLLSNYDTNGIQDKIDRDKALGEKAGVTGTPTWFVNGKKVDEVNDSNVRKAIDEALKEAEK